MKHSEASSIILQPTDTVLTRSQAADYLKISVRTLDKRICEGKIKSIQYGGRGCSVRLRRADLDSFLEACLQ